MRRPSSQINAIRGLQRHDMSMISRSPTIMPSFRPDRIWGDEGIKSGNGLSKFMRRYYRRFLAIFYPPAVYQKKLNLTIKVEVNTSLHPRNI